MVCLCSSVIELLLLSCFRLNAPSHWMLDKLSGVFAPKPSPGPHKQRECLPLTVLLRNRLK